MRKIKYSLILKSNIMKRFLLACIIGSFFIQGFAQYVEEPEFDNQRKQAFKIEILSPLTGNLTVGYEKFIKNWTSFETKIGLIGIGINSLGSQRDYGLFVKLGPKFKIKPNITVSGIRSQYLLGGLYFKPDFILSVFDYSSSDYYHESPFVSLAIMFNLGKQYILGEFMTLDFNFGLGYGYSNYGNRYYYSHFVGGKDFPIAASAGLSIGFLLKNGNKSKTN
jgi:hypothetical protein